MHWHIEMAQDLNPSTCSSLVIFMHWACENHTFNATPTEKLQQHPLVFAMNRTYCTFFLWRLYLAPTSHPGQSTILPLCCDWKGWGASAQSFTLWHQATMKIPRRAHHTSACSHHIGVVFTHIPFVINHTFTIKLRDLNTCSNVGLDFLKWLGVKQISEMQTEKT